MKKIINEITTRMKNLADDFTRLQSEISHERQIIAEKTEKLIAIQGAYNELDALKELIIPKKV